MLSNEELELYNKTLEGKKFKEIVLTDDGCMIVFENDFVLSFWSNGYERFHAEASKRVPTYRYDPIQ